MTAKRVKVTRVIDGDTVETLTERGIFRQPRKSRVRLYGIDAPESTQAGGPEATQHLHRLMGGSQPTLWLDDMGTDRYGRTVGLLYRNRGHPQDSCNYMMIRDGQARAYMVQRADRNRFRQAKERARQKGWGIWKKKKNPAPWEYRRGKREQNNWSIEKTIIFISLALAILVAALVLLPW